MKIVPAGSRLKEAWKIPFSNKDFVKCFARLEKKRPAEEAI